MSAEIATAVAFAHEALGCRPLTHLGIDGQPDRSVCQTHQREWTKDGCPSAFELTDLVEARDRSWKQNLADLASDVVLMDVVTERLAQDRKWGRQDHKPPVWLAILTEEVGELAEAILFHHSGGDERNHTHSTSMRAEAVQIAAVAVQFVHWLDRGGAAVSKS